MKGDGKKKLGLVTWIGGPNYGTVLQAYALHAVLCSLGCDVRIIRKFDFVWGVKLKLNRFLKPLGINILKTRDADTLKMKRVRELQASTFRYQDIIGPFGRCRAGVGYDAYLCGSDQLWNSWNCFDPFFFLDFVRKGRKMAYSVSLGNPEIRPELQPRIKELVSGFDALSLREESGVRTIGSLTGRTDVRLAADPTLLLTADEWKEFASGANFAAPLPDKYILCYLLRRRDDYSEIVDRVRQATGIDSVLIVPSGEYPDLELPGARVVEEAGPREFVSLVANAAAVLTDSFHGTLFSVNLGRDVINLRRFEDSDHKSQNSRLYDLAETLGMGDRFIDGEQWKQPMDHHALSEKVEALRQDSLSYLRGFISSLPKR